MTQSQAIDDVIAAQVRQHRRVKGWSVRQLAEACAALGAPQLTIASLSNIERGQGPKAKRPRRRVGVAELAVLAAALDVPSSALMASQGRWGVSAPGIPDSIPRARVVELVKSLGLDTKHLRNFTLAVHAIEAEVYALNEQGDRYNHDDKNIAIHRIVIPIVDDVTDAHHRQ